jgi:Ca2+-binding EF-hand superfamily protein
MNWRLLSVFALMWLVEYVRAQYDNNRGYTKKKGGGGSLTGILAGIVGSFIGGWRQARKLGKKYKLEKDELLNYIKMQEDIYKQRDNQWQSEYQKLYKAYETLENETLERDYEEFKAPDTNNDEMISRQEFAIYVKKYLSSFPELTEADFPKFDDFDLNHDGMVTFDEWQRYLQMQKQKEAAEAEQGKQRKNNDAYSELLEALGGQFGSQQQRKRGQARVG